MSDQCVGEIRMFAGKYEPDGWAFCDGRHLKLSDYQVLFSLIGTTYGGSGVTDFALPDLRSRVPLGQGIAASKTNYVLGHTGGEEIVTLLTAQTPAHTHGLTGTSVQATTGNPVDQIMAQTVNSAGGTNQDAAYLQLGASTLTKFALNNATVTSTGSNLPHNNLMPSAGVNFIIALQGLYPSFS